MGFGDGCDDQSHCTNSFRTAQSCVEGHRPGAVLEQAGLNRRSHTQTQLLEARRAAIQCDWSLQITS